MRREQGSAAPRSWGRRGDAQGAGRAEVGQTRRGRPDRAHDRRGPRAPDPRGRHPVSFSPTPVVRMEHERSRARGAHRRRHRVRRWRLHPAAQPGRDADGRAQPARRVRHPHRRDAHRIRRGHERPGRVARDRRDAPLRRRRLHHDQGCEPRPRWRRSTSPPGNVNTGFSAGATSHVYALRVKGTRLYVGGAFSTLAGQPRGRIGAVNTTTGALDPDFNPNADNSVHGIVASRPTATPSTSAATSCTSAVGSRRNIAPLSATTGALLPLDLPVPAVRRPRSPNVIDLDISPSGDRLFAALGGYENQALSWSTVTGRRQWGHQVDGDTQAVRYFNGNVYFGFHEGDIGDDTVRMLVADSTTGVVVAPYHLPINSFFGVWDIDVSPGRARARRRVHERQRRRDPGHRDPAPRLERHGPADRAEQPPHHRHHARTPSRLPGTRARTTSAWSATACLRNGVEIGVTDRPHLQRPGSARGHRLHLRGPDASTRPGNFSPSAGPIPAGTDQTLVADRLDLALPRQRIEPGHRVARRPRSTTPRGRPDRRQLGYGDGDEATVVSFGADPNFKFTTTYFRRQFTVDNPATLSNVNLTLMRDDGAVVYVNGVEVARSNMPNGNITNTTYATANVDGAAESQLFAFTVPPAPLRRRRQHRSRSRSTSSTGRARTSASISASSTARPARVRARRSNLRTTAVTGTTAALAWDAPTGRSRATGSTATACSSVRPRARPSRDSGLTSATSYSYTVTAVNTSTLESAPRALVVTTPDVVAPSIPTGLTASTISATRVVLDWSASTDNVGRHRLRPVAQRRRDRQPDRVRTTPTRTSAPPPRTRTRCGPVTPRGTCQRPSVALDVNTPDTTDLTPPSVPENVHATFRSTTMLTLAWDASTDDVGVTSYIVSRNGVDLPATTLNTFTDGLLAPGVTYTYTVRALDATLNISAASSPVPVTTHTPVEATFATGSVWKYTDDGIDRGTAWKDSGYDDSAWKSGAGQLGYGDGDEATVMFNGGTVPDQRFISHYLRRSFTISDARGPERRDALGAARRRRRRLRERCRGVPRQHAGRSDHHQHVRAERDDGCGRDHVHGLHDSARALPRRHQRHRGRAPQREPRGRRRHQLRCRPHHTPRAGGGRTADEPAQHRDDGDVGGSRLGRARAASSPGTASSATESSSAHRPTRRSPTRVSPAPRPTATP